MWDIEVVQVCSYRNPAAPLQVAWKKTLVAVASMGFRHVIGPMDERERYDIEAALSVRKSLCTNRDAVRVTDDVVVNRERMQNCEYKTFFKAYVRQPESKEKRHGCARTRPRCLCCRVAFVVYFDRCLNHRIDMQFVYRWMAHSF